MIFDLFVVAIIGVLFGNYASTVLYRLPKGLPIHGYNIKIGKSPHCSVCGHELKFYEYFPVFSWIFTKGKCNYCGVKINPEYTILEVGSALLAIALYYITGSISDNYILLLVTSTSVLLSVFIFEDQKLAINKLLFAIAILGLIYRTLNEASIVGVVVSLVFACAIYVMLTHDSSDKDIGENFSLKLILLAGVWLNIKYQLVYLVCLYVVNQIRSPVKSRFRALIILLYFIIIIGYIVNHK